jgi:hypothetical protein
MVGPMPEVNFPEPLQPQSSIVPTFYKLSDAHKALGPGAPSEDTLRREVKKGNLRAKRIGAASVSPMSNCAAGRST